MRHRLIFRHFKYRRIANSALPVAQKAPSSFAPRPSRYAPYNADTRHTAYRAVMSERWDGLIRPSIGLLATPPDALECGIGCTKVVG